MNSIDESCCGGGEINPNPSNPSQQFLYFFGNVGKSPMQMIGPRFCIFCNCRHLGRCISPTAHLIQDNLKQRLFRKINEMRAAKGLKSLAADGRLEHAATQHASDLAAGRAKPHDRLIERIKESNFPVYNDKCLISRRAMQANVTEGIVEVPKDMMERAMEFLAGKDISDGHYQDFYDPKLTHVGMGIGEGSSINFVVVDYGRLCNGEAEELTEEDFSAL